MKGFSSRNIKRMRAFYTAYAIVPQAVAQLDATDNQIKVKTLTEKLDRSDIRQQLFLAALSLPWGHNILLIRK